MNNHNTKIRPFKCYFCNKLIDNDTEYGHISSCGLVLEPCPNKCGSYIPRNLKPRHLKECKNKMSKSMSRLSFEDDSYDFRNVKDTLAVQHNAAASTLPKMLPSVHPTPRMEFSEILRKCYNTEKFCQHLSQDMTTVQANQQELMHRYDNSRIQLKINLEKLQYQINILTEWRRNLEMQMQNIKQELSMFTKFQNDTRTKVEDLATIKDANLKIENNIKTFKEHFHKEQLKNRDALSDLQEKLNEFKDYFAQENAVIGALWNDSRADFDKIRSEIVNVNKALDESKTKNSSFVFDVRAVSQISAESADKLEIQERTIGVLKKEVAQLKLNMETSDGQGMGTGSTNDFTGRLLWKISNFSQKMENAKENDVILRSPIFYSHAYGYKIRLQIYLNGIKKWKGRHMIACLHVLKGDYDLLLKWPCFIEGTLILRDLYNQVNTTNFSKYICAKRYSGDEENEEPQESSTQYIFVPHTTLIKQNFIKEDNLFIEVKINSTNKIRDETEL